MKIEFVPQFSKETLSISKDGGMLVINGQPHDFSAIPVGDGVGMVGQILEARRDETGLTVQLLLPHSPDADESVRFPEPVTVTIDGPIAVPGQDAPEPPRTEVFVVPYNAPPLGGRQAAAWERIKAYRDQRQKSGVKVGDHWFHSDDSSRIQQIGLTIMGANMPPGIMWKTMADAFVEMTPTLAGQIFLTSAASDQAIFAVAEGHRIAMEASETPESYDFSGGWPLTFGE